MALCSENIYINHPSFSFTILVIFQLNDGGKAARAHVGIGDVVLTIDGISTDGMTHLEAQNKIKACTGNLNMTLQR